MSEMWTAIATVVSAVVTALAGSGIINYFQNKHKTTVETSGIEQNIISRIRMESDKKNATLVAHIDLFEYRFDMLMEAYLEVIERLRDYPITDVADLRAKAYQIKYLDHIPGREPPAKFPNSPMDDS